MCTNPETFHHNVEKEFDADDIFERNNRAKKRKAAKSGANKETELGE